MAAGKTSPFRMDNLQWGGSEKKMGPEGVLWNSSNATQGAECCMCPGISHEPFGLEKNQAEVVQ